MSWNKNFTPIVHTSSITTSQGINGRNPSTDGTTLDNHLTDYNNKVNQELKTTSSPLFANVNVTGTVDGVDVGTFKNDYDNKVNQDVRTSANPTFNNLVVSSFRNTGQVFHDTSLVISALVTVQASDHMLLVSHTSLSPVTMFIPGSPGNVGRMLIIKDTGGNCSVNNITLTATGVDRIDGNTTLTMSTNYQSVSLFCDGSTWFTV